MIRLHWLCAEIPVLGFARVANQTHVLHRAFVTMSFCVYLFSVRSVRIEESAWILQCYDCCNEACPSVKNKHIVHKFWCQFVDIQGDVTISVDRNIRNDLSVSMSRHVFPVIKCPIYSLVVSFDFWCIMTSQGTKMWRTSSHVARFKNHSGVYFTQTINFHSLTSSSFTSLTSGRAYRKMLLCTAWLLPKVLSLDLPSLGYLSS